MQWIQQTKTPVNYINPVNAIGPFRPINPINLKYPQSPIITINITNSVNSFKYCHI